MVYGKLAVGLLLGAAVLPAQAAAQDAGKKVVIGLHATLEHDSNVSRTSAVEATLQGLTPADTLFTPSVTVGLLMPVGRQSVFLNGAAGYSFYDQNTSLNRERLDFTGGVNSRFGPCNTTVSGVYNRGLSKVEDPILISTVENVQSTTRALLEVSCARPSGLGVVFNASKDWVANDLDVMKQSDYESTALMAGISYGRPALGTLTVFVSHDQTDYTKRVIADGYEMNSVGVTFNRQLGARIQGSVTVAYASVEQSSGLLAGSQNSSSESTTYAASLSYRVSEKLNVQGSFDRSIRPSSGIGRTYDLSTGYRVSGEYALGSRLALGAGFGRVDLESQGILSSPLLILTASTTQTYFGSLRYQQSKRLSFVLNAMREERTANVPQFEYTSNRIGLTADLSF
ncbi:MAG: outer membrane beta-barrel protein [Pseudomonadota bacterium]